MACLDDNLAAEFASGSLSGPAVGQVERHLATCRDCRNLVAALAVDTDVDSDVDTGLAPPPERRALGKRRNIEVAPTEPTAMTVPVVVTGELIGRYVVLGRLGAGGMGVVYSAYDPHLDRKVALKLLRPGSGLGAREARQRLVREAKAIAQLSHPNVVAVYDVGSAESGAVYIAMEFVEGDTATTWMARWDRTWRDVLEVYRQAGRGLAAAHDVNMLHRDFKPDNVLVGTDNRVRVSDFGLARSLLPGAVGRHDDAAAALGPELAARLATLTATGTVLGTPRYMAPEQLRGKETDARSDQFSFCVALYEALYGVHPLAGDTAVDMIEHGAAARPPPEHASAPLWLFRALARGLDVEPSRRFPSMHALLAELTPLPVRAPRRAAVVIGGALALVAGGAAAAMVFRGDPPPPAVTPAQVAALQGEIEQLRAERDRLFDKLGANPPREQLDAVITELQRKTERIKVLEQVMTANGLDPDAPVAADDGAGDGALAARPIVTPRPPRPRPPPPEPGLTVDQARASLRLAVDEIAVCLGEWAERRMEHEASIDVAFIVAPGGQPGQVSTSAFDDSVVPDCVTGQLLAARFPASTVSTEFAGGVWWHDGAIELRLRRTGIAPPPMALPLPTIEPSGPAPSPPSVIEAALPAIQR